MNFKSNAAYKAWLAYGHASGEFAKTPGHQPVSIKGKSKTVEHALGGELGDPETSPLNAYEVSYGDLPPELERYMSMPGVNPTKVMEWFNLGLAEPQTYNQAKLLAEAVGYNSEQAKVVAAQWQMESGGGSKLSSPYNYFGIKSHNEDVRQRLLERGIDVSTGKEAKTSEYKDGKKAPQKSSFMEFNNAFEGFAAHKAFLETNPRYAKALSTENAKDFAVGLEKAGYATAPNYGTTLYQNYIAPKEKNPKAGDSRPKSLGETKSEKIKPFTQDTAPRAEVEKLPLLPPQRLEVETPINLEPTITSGMYGSMPYEAKVEPTKAIPMDAPAGFFSSGKTMFNYGGLMNNYRQGGFNNPGFNALPPEVQNKIKARTFAAGGPMAGPLTEFNTGGTHEENPLGGIPQGVAPDGKVNLVEQGETKLDSANYIFSDKLKVSKEIAEQFNLPSKSVGKTFSEVSKSLNLPKSRRENDTIENNYKEKMLDELVKAQELHKQEEMAKDFAIMAEKYPEQMAAMMQAQQPQMAPSVPGEVMAAGINPAQEAPSPEAIPSSQLPMSYGGSLYGCGGKMYAPGGWLEENQGAVSGAAQGFLSGAATGAAMGAATGPLAFLGAPAGALIGGTISAFAQGRKGAQEDEARADAKLAEQNAQYAQSAANPNVGVATAGMPVTPMPGTAPMYPNYQANVARNGGTLPSYHQYPQSSEAQFANNAGPMGQPLTNLYAPGGSLESPMPPDNAPAGTPFNIADRNSWIGSYTSIPMGHDLSLPLSSLPGIGSTISSGLATPNYKTVGDYVTAAENWERSSRTGLSPGPISFITAPSTTTISSGTPSVPSKAYFIKGPNDENKWVDEAIYNAHKGVKTTMPLDESGYPVMPGTGGQRYTDYDKSPSGVPAYNRAGYTFAMGGHMYDGVTEPTNQMFTSLQPSPYLPGQEDLPVPYGPQNNPSVTTNTSGNSGNYGVNTSLTDTKQDLSVTGTPLQTLSQLAPIAYNTYQALKKPQSYKPSDFYTLQEAIRPDYGQAYNEAKNTYAQMMKNAAQTGLSGGARAAYMANTAFERNRAMGQVAMAEENAYREDMARVRAANAQAQTEGKKLALQTNWAMQAAKQEHFKEALNQFKAIQESQLANKLATNYAIMGAPDISKFKNIGYTPYLESLFNRQKQG